MPGVKVRGGVPGYPRHARAHAYTFHRGNDPTHLHSSGFDSDVRTPATTSPLIVRTVGKARKTWQCLDIWPVPPGAAQQPGMIDRRTADIRTKGLRPAVVDQAIRPRHRARSEGIA